jgi:hypothetical protein
VENGTLRTVWIRVSVALWGPLTAHSGGGVNLVNYQVFTASF